MNSDQLRYERATGQTLDEMRDNISPALRDSGDCILVWVNEGDLSLLRLRAQADAQPVAWLDPVSQYSASQWLIDNMNPEQRADFSVPLYAAPAPAAQREPTPGERLREAGFTRRDNRIECGECGKLFTPQFLQIHKCGGGDE